MSDLKSVVAQGNRRESLEEIRDLLAGEIPEAEPRDMAALTRELRAVLAEIDAIPIAREDSVADKLAGEVDAQREKRKRAGRGKNTTSL